MIHHTRRPTYAVSLADSMACFARVRQSSTALSQSEFAVRVSGSGGAYTVSSSMMQGGTASVHFFKQMFAAAPVPQASSRTLVLQQAPSESWPRTDLQVA